ncbi:unnamed protein product [Plasmodium vivax]|uniref:(malaria parasite P. vivax) hypothetical protein n=1 Tax=Plasmodium vivax TaxID=5855 RepID=A0A8S4HLA9_PLAVI|nr:unnamed protein product [Plasmodium vivax]
MVLLSNCNLGKNVIFTGFLKYFTFTFLIWTYHTYNDLGKFSKSLEKKYENDEKLNAILNRLLARHELETQSKHISLYGNSLEYKNNQKIKNIKECESIYGRMKENNLKNNRKTDIHKNAKMKRITKLDGYCEQTILNEIDKINAFAKNMYNIRNYNKKVLHKKYRLRFILLCLFPFIGIIIMALSIEYSSENACKNCRDLLYNSCLIEKGAISAHAFLIISSYIILLLIIYFIRKYIKYEKIKAGKGKMSIKEYFLWLKDIL